MGIDQYLRLQVACIELCILLAPFRGLVLDVPRLVQNVRRVDALFLNNVSAACFSIGCLQCVLQNVLSYSQIRPTRHLENN